MVNREKIVLRGGKKHSAANILKDKEWAPAKLLGEGTDERAIKASWLDVCGWLFCFTGGDTVGTVDTEDLLSSSEGGL